MPFTVDEQHSAALITIKGKFLGSVEGDAFRESLDNLKESGKTNVVIDLSQATFMDSSGIGLLISGLTTMKKAGGEIRLANIEKRIKNLFVITRLLGPVFDDFESVDAAMQSFETNPPS